MEENNTGKINKNHIVPSVKKLTYEELENTAHQLSEQSRQLYLKNQELTRALEEANATNFYKRLDYLWNVITCESILPIQFKEKCSKEFQDLMIQPEQEDELKD